MISNKMKIRYLSVTNKTGYNQTNLLLYSLCYQFLNTIEVDLMDILKRQHFWGKMLL